MKAQSEKKILSLSILFLLLSGCTTGSVLDTGGPSISQAQTVSAVGPKARIAVAQFVNNTGGLEAQMQRMAVRTQAQMANMGREMIEFQKKMIPYQHALAAWQARVNAVGQEKAGPPPEPPKMDSVSSSPYMATVSDPVAGGIRDMMINALFNSGKYIVLERQEINTINWEQEFSKSAHVGSKVVIPAGQIEGAELLIIGSLNTLNANGSGADIGGYLDTAASVTPFFDLPYAEAASNVRLKIKSAQSGMEIRLVDTRTSRVVAATTVEGSAQSFEAGAARSTYTYNAGELPSGISLYHNTPIEKAFRKMVDAAVAFLVEKTPENYFHNQ